MDHPLRVALLAAGAWLAGTAGGVFYDSNQSAEYIRTFDRNSAIDNADIVYYNPAGTVNLRPGLTLAFSNQTLLQWATVRPLGNPVLGGRNYESRNPVWCLPDLYAAYRRDGWAVFTAIQPLGATALRRWRDGLPSLDLAGKQGAGYGGKASTRIGENAYGAVLEAGGSQAQAQAAAAAAGLDASPFPSGSWLKGASAFLAWRHGAAWRTGPRSALFLAGRLVWARQDIQGGVRGACTYQQPGLDLRTTFLAPINVTFRALGYSAEFGVNVYPVPGMVLNLTYEMATRLDFRTTVRNGAGGDGRFVDGARAHLDLPPAWRFGLGWQLGPRLRASAGLDAYLEHSARMDLLDDPGEHIDSRRDYRNTWEESAALEYRFNRRWLGSLGVNFNQIGQRRTATLDTSLPGAHNNYLSLGTGFQYEPSERFRFNAGIGWTGFIHRYASADFRGDQGLQAAFAAGGAAISPSKEYDKRYLILAFGFECHLP